MTDYEQSPDYGDPELGWHADVGVVMLVVMVIGTTLYVFMR
jgi:hypothetical protein